MKTARSFNASSKSNTSPNMYNSCQLGSLNPDALKLPILRHKSLTATYDHIAQLSAEAERLQQENRCLQNRLQELTSESNEDSNNNDNNNPFSSFKRREMQFAQKLIERDNELNTFARVINEYRVVKDPTFVEVAANANIKNQSSKQNQKQHLESISASLLVSNPQRPFFKRDDVEKQNEDLRALISQQEETLRLLRARLTLFHQHDQENTLSFTLNSLKKGQTPVLLADSAPSKRKELEIKKKFLTKELQKLIKQRKELAKERSAEKENMRALALKALQNPKKEKKTDKKKKQDQAKQNQENQNNQKANQDQNQENPGQQPNQEQELDNQQNQEEQLDQQQEDDIQRQNQEEIQQNQPQRDGNQQQNADEQQNSEQQQNQEEQRQNQDHEEYFQNSEQQQNQEEQVEDYQQNQEVDQNQEEQNDFQSQQAEDQQQNENTEQQPNQEESQQPN